LTHNEPLTVGHIFMGDGGELFGDDVTIVDLDEEAVGVLVSGGFGVGAEGGGVASLGTSADDPRRRYGPGIVQLP
jgi:hypothetical protein